ncbi:hypothetical protein SNL152K_3453 [Streptomyces sp. NL15-2K]|nr:hypothetical protein SNL152K_3453 [Streptomyces sp. NL15-2K]
MPGSTHGVPPHADPLPANIRAISAKRTRTPPLEGSAIRMHASERGDETEDPQPCSSIFT